MLPSIFDLGQHFTNVGSKIFNDDLDATILYTLLTVDSQQLPPATERQVSL